MEQCHPEYDQEILGLRQLQLFDSMQL